MATGSVTLTQLAHQAAAQIGFTARRWWRDATEPYVLQVEVERRLVGAPPAIATLAVPLPSSGTFSRRRAEPIAVRTQVRSTTRRKRPVARSHQSGRPRKV